MAMSSTSRVKETRPGSVHRKAHQRVAIQDRLDHGNLTIDEVCALKNRGRTGFYEDLKAGLVEIQKVGRKSIVPGHIAKRYIAGEPLTRGADFSANSSPKHVQNQCAVAAA